MKQPRHTCPALEPSTPPPDLRGCCIALLALSTLIGLALLRGIFTIASAIWEYLQ